MENLRFAAILIPQEWYLRHRLGEPKAILFDVPLNNKINTFLFDGWVIRHSFALGLT